MLLFFEFRFAECSVDPEYIFPHEVEIVFSVINLLIFLFGISGNLWVLWVVLFNNHMRSTTNIFIANLAIADIIMCLGYFPKLPHV